MQTTAKIVVLCVCLEVCAFNAFAQRPPALPPTIAAPTDDFSKPPDLTRHRASVEYTADKLKVQADNSSLKQILEEVGSKIGMKITGAIPEERVFGIYGPAEPAVVLAHLLTGSGSNILLREDSRRIPRELILTQRTGGPSPPSPSSGADSGDLADSEYQPPQLSPQVHDSPPPFPAPSAAIRPGGLPASAPTNQGASQPGTTTEQAPNGVRTPQQIYDELVQLQQKNAPTAPK